jgi:hypothetical protein
VKGKLEGANGSGRDDILETELAKFRVKHELNATFPFLRQTHEHGAIGTDVCPHKVEETLSCS